VQGIARKLPVVIWHVLTEQVADRQAEPEIVARYLMNWASQRAVANRHLGMRRPAFVRQQPDQLGLGAEMIQYRWGSQIFKLPPSSLTSGLVA
jgi:hypothetical protein